MKLLQILSISSFIHFTAASNDCQPATWSKKRSDTVGSYVFAQAGASVVNVGNVQPGQINCRYWATTYDPVNYYTCTQLADKYGITTDLFFQLNPDLTPDCGNIKQNTDYCVKGFVEPLRAENGKCGPPNQNATCLGTAFQCCNAQTWTCGNSTADCAPGTCYEGACSGDIIYSTDGT